MTSAVEFEKSITEQFRNFDGWCTVEKACAMFRLIESSKVKIDSAVELGVFAGRSLVALGLALQKCWPGARLVGIDAWCKDASQEGTNDQANADWWAAIDYDYFYKYAQNKLIENKIHGTTTLMRGKSIDSVGKFADQSIALLHQDSNHSEEVSCAEVIAWVPKMKLNSLWILDDTNWPTTRAAQKLLTQHGFTEIADHTTWKVYIKTQ